MTFTQLMGEDSPTLFGIYVVGGCFWALITLVVAVVCSSTPGSDNGNDARKMARMFFETPIWPVITVLHLFKWTMRLYHIAYDEDES